MLQINNLDVSYGDIQVLHDVSIDVQEGELVAVIGSNGAGKTTLLKTISGLLKSQKGTIEFQDKQINTLEAYQIAKAGIVQVPEGRLLFADMTVRENLEMGGFSLSNKEQLEQRIDYVLMYFRF